MCVFANPTSELMPAVSTDVLLPPYVRRSVEVKLLQIAVPLAPSRLIVPPELRPELESMKTSSLTVGSTAPPAPPEEALQ